MLCDICIMTFEVTSFTALEIGSMSLHLSGHNNNNNDRLTAFDPGQPG